MPRLVDTIRAADRVRARTRRIDRRRQLRRLGVEALSSARTRCSSRRAAAARAAGKSQHAVESATFAMVAWIDEIARACAGLGRPDAAAAGAAVQLEQRAERVLPSPGGTAAAGGGGARGLLAGAGARLHRPVLLRARRQRRARQAEGTAWTATAGARRWRSRHWRASASRRSRTNRRRRPVRGFRSGASGWPCWWRPRSPCCCRRAGWRPHGLARPPQPARWRCASSSGCSSFACADLSASVDAGGTTHVSGFVSRPEDIGAGRARSAGAARRRGTELSTGAARLAALRGGVDPQALPDARHGDASGTRRGCDDGARRDAARGRPRAAAGHQRPAGQPPVGRLLHGRWRGAALAGRPGAGPSRRRRACGIRAGRSGRAGW